MLGSVAIALLLRVGGTVLWLLFSIVVARNLSVEEFGLIFFVINVIMTGGTVAIAGYDVTVLRFGARFWRDEEKQEFRNLFSEAQQAVIVVGSIVTLALVVGVLAGLDTPVTHGMPIAIFVGGAITAIGLMSVERDVLRAGGKLQEALFAFSIIRALVPLILTTIAWLWGVLNTSVIFVAYLTALLAALAWGRWRIGKLELPPKRTAPAQYLKVALAIWPGNAGLVAFQGAPAIVIGLAGGLGAAGLFIAAQRIAQLGTFLTDAVRTAVGPNLAQADGKGQQEAVTHASFLMAISGLLGICFLLSLGWVLLWMFGPEYRSALPVLLVLLVGQLSWTVLGPTALVLNMFGEEKVRSVIGVSTTIMLLVVLPMFDTAIGVATVVAFMSWVMNFALWLAIRIRLNIRCGIVGIGIKEALWLLEEERYTLDNLLLRIKKRDKKH
ncbi:lipopolysaccharide biosynthesis protein [Celeribacter halophilus]|uniref:lipopolysaccharide biosynthesis protein n=1 Tax=Celeribacter halophilus TaxID=576117 RepID=UPI002FD1F4E4